MKKTISLLFLLAIPIVIFLFLKIFGTNTYEVPHPFEAGIPDCEGRDDKVPALQLADGNVWRMPDQTYVVFGVLRAMKKEQNIRLVTELVRIQDAFYGTGTPLFVLLTSERDDNFKDICDQTGLEKSRRMLLLADNEEMMNFLRCGIALTGKADDSLTNLVLADKEGRIRGVYDSTDAEETDRLILELKILRS